MVLNHHPKDWLSHESQLNRLIERGMTVTNKPKAIDYLQRNSIWG